MLRDRYRTIVQSEWDGRRVDAMVALHARRSAASVGAYRLRHPQGPLAVMLTGTDLYRDLPASAEAARTLDLADRIVLLQDDAVRLLESRWRRKAQVIFQSAPFLAPRPKAARRVDCVVVGHLRTEKDPATLLRAVRRLGAGIPVRIRHIGAPLDQTLAEAARELQRVEPRYRYAGALPHGLTRLAIARAHLLVHPSIMEGGANVIAEAVAAGTPVIASRVSGNVGMLGGAYPGYFEAGDDAGLARCLTRAAQEHGYLRALRAACARRKPLFAPRRERKAVRELLAGLLEEAGR